MTEVLKNKEERMGNHMARTAYDVKAGWIWQEDL
jgi:hypothetical protein